MALPDGSRLRAILERLTPKQRQYAALAALMVCGVGLLWAVFAFSDSGTKASPAQKAPTSPGAGVTNIGVMSPGQQVNPVDQWVGTAGRKLAQYEQERDEQSRINKDRKDFEDRTMKRFGELEQRLMAPAQPPANSVAPPVPPPAPAAPVSPASSPVQFPPASALPTNLPPPPLKPGASAAFPVSAPGALETPSPGLVRVSMADPKPASPPPSGTSASSSPRDANARTDTVDTYLPVSFTRGILLGGLDAPTGGQAQSNPHPILIRLSDNSVLPNRFRAEYRECFVIAAGYGDISSERAYLRTESLSCVRDDGSTLEVKIQGSVYGEDGKVGIRGRVVTKQGQILANALLAGVASGLGQSLALSATSFSTSPLGSVATTSGSDIYRAGLGTGVGRALDRLAQYYIKLAEQTFPVIEIDAGRTIDVVITKGVRVDASPTTKPRLRPSSGAALPEERYLKVSQDEDY